MIIFDENGNVIQNPDLNVGRLEERTLNVIHTYIVDSEEEGHYVTIAEYPNGGKDVEWVVDKPEQHRIETRDENGDVVKHYDGDPGYVSKLEPTKDVWVYQVYIQYTEEELSIIEAAKVEAEFQSRVNSQTVVAIQMFVTSTNLTDEQALQVEALYPEWKIGEQYEEDDIRRYNDELYRSLQASTGSAEHTPNTATALWKKILPAEEPGGYLPWVQPLGATDAYNEGDRVIHKDKVWESTCDNNTWEPGVYGWEVIQ